MRGWWMIAALAACRLGFEDQPVPDATVVVDAVVDVAIDAPRCEDAICEAAGGVCDAGVCVVSRTGESSVRCPAGMPCRIECTGNGRPCRDGAACGDATSCEVRCIGYRACQAGVSCDAASTCDVTCDGEEACEAGITAEPTTTCAASCCGLETCNGGTATCARDDVCS